MFTLFDIFSLTLTIHYPSDMDSLTRWAKRLFGVYYAVGLTCAAAFLAGIWLAIEGKPWWVVVGLAALWIACSGAAHGLERLVSEVDQRRFALLQAQYTDDA